MKNLFRNYWNRLKAQAEEDRRREAERRQMLREINEAWIEMNKDFIKANNRAIEKEIADRYDFNKIPEPSAYNFDGSPLSK